MVAESIINLESKISKTKNKKEYQVKLPKRKKIKPKPITQEQLLFERINQVRTELDEKILMIKKNIRLRG